MYCSPSSSLQVTWSNISRSVINSRFALIASCNPIPCKKGLSTASLTASLKLNNWCHWCRKVELWTVPNFWSYKIISMNCNKRNESSIEQEISIILKEDDTINTFKEIVNCGIFSTFPFGSWHIEIWNQYLASY